MNKGLLSVDEALEVLLAGATTVPDVEDVSTLEATDRVLARAQSSTMDVPPMDNSAMDGYAVRVADIASPDTRLRVAQRIAAGTVGGPLESGTAARIFTGAPIPAGADAVVMQEFCAVDGDHVVVKKKPQPEEWVRRAGSDIRAGGAVLAAGIKLRPQDTGLAASVGIKTLPVRRKVRMALFFTGDELVMPGDPLPPGRIYNSNRFTLNGMAKLFGCEVRDYGIVPDRLDATREVLRRAAAENDIIVTSGGVSVGEEDHVKPAVEAEGSLLMWKIAMKPGRPLAFGKVKDAAFIGLPGLIAICQSSIRPSACTAGRRWSSSPTDTPPEVTIRSFSAAARRSISRVASSLSGTMPESRTTQPKAAASPFNVKRLEL